MRMKIIKRSNHSRRQLRYIAIEAFFVLCARCMVIYAPKRDRSDGQASSRDHDTHDFDASHHESYDPMSRIKLKKRSRI